MRCSMSRKSNCWGHAPTESLWGSMKVGRLYGQRFETVRAAKDEVIDWLPSTTADVCTRRWAMSARCDSNGAGSPPKKCEPRKSPSYGMRNSRARSRSKRRNHKTETHCMVVL